MRHLTYILILALLSCSKSSNNNEFNVPASIIDEFASFGPCNIKCSTKILLITYNGENYYKNGYAGRCEGLPLQKLYYNDGTAFEGTPELFNKIVAEGKDERVVWQCKKVVP